MYLHVRMPIRLPRLPALVETQIAFGVEIPISAGGHSTILSLVECYMSRLMETILHHLTLHSCTLVCLHTSPPDPPSS